MKINSRDKSETLSGLVIENLFLLVGSRVFFPIRAAMSFSHFSVSYLRVPPLFAIVLLFDYIAVYCVGFHATSGPSSHV